ncbi:MAG: hypothetical protein K6G61_11280 [Solobacterium sp.]|nr:hypothetical protein [Solobacterium sp.]
MKISAHEHQEIPQARTGTVIESSELRGWKRKITDGTILFCAFAAVAFIAYCALTEQINLIWRYLPVFFLLVTSCIFLASIFVYIQDKNDIRKRCFITEGVVTGNRQVLRTVGNDLNTSMESQKALYSYGHHTQQMYVPVIRYNINGIAYETAAENMAQAEPFSQGPVRIIADRTDPRNISVYVNSILFIAVSGIFMAVSLIAVLVTFLLF